MDKFNTLEMFVCVVEKDGFSAASKVLGVNPSTISKAVNRLEKEVGFKLFQRSTRVLKLTAEGQTYLSTVKRILSELTNSEDRIRTQNDAPVGRLKINCPIGYGRQYIAPFIPKFRRLHPQLDLDITFSDAYIDMIGEGYDVSVRSGSMQDSRLIARKISGMDIVTVASPRLAEELTKPLSLSQYKKLYWLLFRFSQTGRLAPIQVNDCSDSTFFTPEQNYTSSNDGEVLIEFCKKNMGYLQLPHFLLRSALKEGSVIPITKTITSSQWSIYAVYPDRDYLPAKTKCFIDFFKSEILQMNETPTGTWAKSLTPLKKANANLFENH